jgi:hypothetical protein
MKIACIGEGPTEYTCLPTILGRLGHVVVGTLTCNGCPENWEQAIRQKVTPRVFGLAEKEPDKVLVVLDREDRSECCPDLARSALNLISEALRLRNVTCSVAVIVADRTFESILFADYENLDRLTILNGPVSHSFGEATDGLKVLSSLKGQLQPGQRYDKVYHGKGLAQRLKLDDANVLARSRPLRKLLKEAPAVEI